MEKLSIIVPCFNEESMVNTFFSKTNEIVKKIKDIKAEYIFVDDGSTDKTLLLLKILHNNYDNVHFVSFSRNFGKEAALLAGLKQSDGNFVVVMDADLQDPPELISKMYRIIKEKQIDCVGTRRLDRTSEPRVRSFFSKLFYKVINKISDTDIVDGARDFRMMTRQMVDAILDMPEVNRFSKGIFSWVGFNTEYLEYNNVERKAGSTSWSFYKLLKYSVDGIIDFSDVPLSIASWTGFCTFILAIIGLLGIVIRALILPNSSVSGWASLICVVLLLGGLQLLCMGIIGKYIGKIYLQSKNRPVYIIKEIK